MPRPPTHLNRHLNQIARYLLTRPANSPPTIFHTATKIQQKARAALSPTASDYDYLRDELARRLCDRLNDTSRNYPTALDFGCGAGHILKVLNSGGNGKGVEVLNMCDVHERVLERAQDVVEGGKEEGGVKVGKRFVFGDENVDGFGGLEDGSLDLVVSGGVLHWVNDLPGLLTRLSGLLKDDGLFLGVMFGGDTLQELRISMQLAEEEVKGGVSVHVSPMVQVRDVGSVLGRAGFELTTIDVDQVVVPYPDMKTLMKHLKGMGEGNAVAVRKGYFGKKAFERAGVLYDEMFGYPDPDQEGKRLINATFHLIFMIGWKRAESQAKPRPRGSAQFSLDDLSSVVGNQDK